MRLLSTFVPVNFVFPVKLTKLRVVGEVPEFNLLALILCNDNLRRWKYLYSLL